MNCICHWDRPDTSKHFLDCPMNPNREQTVLKDRVTLDHIEELIGPVCMLAELPTAAEKPGAPDDHNLDLLIMAARYIKAREGFEVR